MQEDRAQVQVLVVDDAVVVRRMITAAFDAEADLTVAGIARDGDAALRAAADLRPDVVVLDLELPGRSGMDTLVELRLRHPDLPVVVFSRTIGDDPAVRLTALARGASACVAKPGSREGIGLAVEQVRSLLVAAVRTAATARTRAASPAAPVGAGAPLRPFVARPAPVEAVVIAASTGGPVALERLVSALPAELPIPVLVVQHIPASFVPLLAVRMTRAGGPLVTQAVHGEPIRAGHVYLAPGARHLTVAGTRAEPVVVLEDGPPENSCRPAADTLLRSAAALWGPGVLAVILTGMGCDGVQGCARVRERDGTVLVQDRATSVVWGMPGLVAEAGLAHSVLPLDDIAPKILALLARAGGAVR